MASGTIAPTVAPVAKRAATSSGSDGASAQARLPAAEIAVTQNTMRYLPMRSPIGPFTTCSRP
jgi:hypothetical protein